MSGLDGWEPLFWTVFERSANPIVLVDEQRRVVDVNPPVLELLGCSRGALIGRSIAELIVDGRRSESWERWREFMRTGEYSGRRTFRHGNGPEIEIEFAGRLAIVEGRRLAVFVWLLDVDPRADETPAAKYRSDLLTNREIEVIRLIALGRDTAGMATDLSISPETVKTHVRNAMRKLGVHTRAQLVAMCMCIDATAMPLPPER